LIPIARRKKRPRVLPPNLRWGVGGRCSAGEAAKDSAKRTAGIEDKGPLEKKGKDDSGPAKSAVKKAAD
jgi:hypothetical protein